LITIKIKQAESCLAKLERMNKAFRQKKPDRVPISDFFRGSFVLRKRNLAKGGGFIFQPEHSVYGAVSGETCDYIVKSWLLNASMLLCKKVI